MAAAAHTYLGARLGAVHDGVTLEDGVGVADAAEPLLGGRVARVDDPPVRLSQGTRWVVVLHGRKRGSVCKIMAQGNNILWRHKYDLDGFCTDDMSYMEKKAPANKRLT